MGKAAAIDRSFPKARAYPAYGDGIKPSGYEQKSDPV
jgi:hypothetical protein